jgi:hypothetical protein
MKVEPIILPQADAARAVVESKLEQVFLEEMMKYCGPTAMEGAFSGGAGEDQFNSFLNREYATSLAGRLDLGLGRATGGISV